MSNLTSIPTTFAPSILTQPSVIHGNFTMSPSISSSPSQNFLSKTFKYSQYFNGDFLFSVTDQIVLSGDGTTVALTGVLSSSNFVGTVRVYRLFENTWIQIGQFSGLYENDLFGRFISLSFDGRIVAIGTGRGRYVKVMRYEDGGVWADEILEEFDVYGSRLVSYGRSVSISNDGSLLVVTAEDRILSYMTGEYGQWSLSHVPINYSNSIVEPRSHLSDPRMNSLVAKLSGDGRTMAVYSDEYYKNHDVSIYTNDGSRSWKLDKKIGLESNYIAADISSNGRMIACGNMGPESNMIQTFGLRRGVSKWNQIGQNITLDDSSESLMSMSLAGDGRTISVSVSRYDVGYVKVFKLLRNDTWIQFGETIDGQLQNDLFGEGLSMSGNGTRIAIAAPAMNFKNGPFDYQKSHGQVLFYNQEESSDFGDGIFVTILPTLSPSTSMSPSMSSSSSPSSFPTTTSSSSSVSSENPSSIPIPTPTPSVPKKDTTIAPSAATKSSRVQLPKAPHQPPLIPDYSELFTMSQEEDQQEATTKSESSPNQSPVSSLTSSSSTSATNLRSSQPTVNVNEQSNGQEKNDVSGGSRMKNGYYIMTNIGNGGISSHFVLTMMTMMLSLCLL